MAGLLQIIRVSLSATNRNYLQQIAAHYLQHFFIICNNKICTLEHSCNNSKMLQEIQKCCRYWACNSPVTYMQHTCNICATCCSDCTLIFCNIFCNNSATRGPNCLQQWCNMMQRFTTALSAILMQHSSCIHCNKSATLPVTFLATSSPKYMQHALGTNEIGFIARTHRRPRRNAHCMSLASRCCRARA